MFLNHKPLFRKFRNLLLAIIAKILIIALTILNVFESQSFIL